MGNALFFSFGYLRLKPVSVEIRLNLRFRMGSPSILELYNHEEPNYNNPSWHKISNKSCL